MLSSIPLKAQQPAIPSDVRWQTSDLAAEIMTDTADLSDTLAAVAVFEPAPDTVFPLAGILQSFSHGTALEVLMSKRLAYYKQHPTQGYSVLFFSASGNHSGVAAEDAEEQFQTLYPGTPTYLSYDAPYYKLKAGNFRTRLEASAFLAQIQNEYPNAFVVRDVLDIKHLLLLDLPQSQPVEETDHASEEAHPPATATDAERRIDVDAANRYTD